MDESLKPFSEEPQSEESNEVLERVQELKKLLLQKDPIYITGLDFIAFNFGDESQEHSMAGSSSKITGSPNGSAVIDRVTGKWKFVESGMRITNISHVSKYDKVETKLTFEQIKKLINTKE